MLRDFLSEFVLHQWQEVGETQQDLLTKKATLSQNASRQRWPAGRVVGMFSKSFFAASAGKILTTHQHEPQRAEDHGDHHRYEGNLGILLKGYWVSGSFCHPDCYQIGTGPDHGAITA